MKQKTFLRVAALYVVCALQIGVSPPEVTAQTAPSVPRLSWLPNELELKRQNSQFQDELAKYSQTANFAAFQKLNAAGEKRDLRRVWNWSNRSFNLARPKNAALYEVAAEHALAAIELQKLAAQNPDNAALAQFLAFKAARQLALAPVHGEEKKRFVRLSSQIYTLLIFPNWAQIPEKNWGDSNVPWLNLERPLVLREAAAIYRDGGQTTFCGNGAPPEHRTFR